MIAYIRTRHCSQSYISCNLVPQSSYPLHELKIHIDNIYKTVCFCRNTQIGCFYFAETFFRFFKIST